MARNSYWFTPQENISAYELAFIVMKCDPHAAHKTGIVITDKQWDNIPDGVKRHFKLGLPEEFDT